MAIFFFLASLVAGLLAVVDDEDDQWLVVQYVFLTVAIILAFL